MHPTSDRLERALSRMPAPLVSERARERLLTLSRLACPNVDLVYVECRVSSDAADQVDVSFSAATYAARAALTRQVGQLVEHESTLWAPVHRTLERWCQRDTEEASTLESACLEYDLAPEHTGLGRPALFFRAAALSHPWDLPCTRRGLQQVIAWIAGQRTCALTEQLEAVLRALPQNFHIAHLGFMFSRADETLRFDVAIPSSDVECFLRRLAWGGTLAGRREALLLAERSGWVTLAFGFGTVGVSARLGIEVFPSGPAGGTLLLGQLLEQKWCTTAKGDALGAFLRQSASGYRAELSHAKFVIDEGRGVETKLYLVLAPEGSRPGRLAPVAHVLGPRAEADGARHGAA